MPEYIAYTLPPPTGGLNLIDPIDAMPAEDALVLTNFYPTGQNASLRGGYSSLVTNADYVGLWELPLQNGTSKLVGSTTTKLFEVSTGSASDITGTTTPTTGQWMGHVFASRLFLCNGTDVAQVYDGSTVTDLNITGVAEQDLINVSSYKERLYFVEKQSASIWYLGTKVITGAATEFDVQYYLTRGGYVMFAGSYTNRQAETSQDLFVIASSEGEILLYSGSNPGDASWTLIARYFCGRPMGYRAFVPVENDLFIITSAGIIPVSKLFSQGASLAAQTVSRKINPAISTAAVAVGADYIWSGFYWQAGRRMIINVPISMTASEQYVMNTDTGAWCKYDYATVQPIAFAKLEDELFFSSAGGVFQAENGRLDNTIAITLDWRASWNYFGNRGNWKRFVDARPIFRGSRINGIGLSIDTDYQERPVTSTIAVTAAGSTPWGSPWGSPWGGQVAFSYDRYTLAGQGFCGALRMYGALENARLALNAVEIRYERGAQV